PQRSSLEALFAQLGAPLLSPVQPTPQMSGDSIKEEKSDSNAQQQSNGGPFSPLTLPVAPVRLPVSFGLMDSTTLEPIVRPVLDGAFSETAATDASLLQLLKPVTEDSQKRKEERVSVL